MWLYNSYNHDFLSSLTFMLHSSPSFSLFTFHSMMQISRMHALIDRYSPNFLQVHQHKRTLRTVVMVMLGINSCLYYLLGKCILPCLILIQDSLNHRVSHCSRKCLPINLNFFLESIRYQHFNILYSPIIPSGHTIYLHRKWAIGNSFSEEVFILWIILMDSWFSGKILRFLYYSWKKLCLPVHWTCRSIPSKLMVKSLEMLV